MSSFWGISYNKWHGVLAFAIVLFTIVSSVWWLKTELLQVHFIVAVVAGNVIAMLLQLWNEWIQLVSKDLLKNYGTLKKAQANSKDDMKWYMIGSFAGTVLGVLVLTVLDKVWNLM